MPKFPLVSIAMATFNGEKYLAKQLDSLLAQDYPNLEFVFSDDCSSDRTWEILQSYSKKDARVRLLPQEKNLGYVGNFIRAFNACNGPLISPSDQDDIWHLNKTRRLVETMDDAQLIYCNSRFIDESDRPLGKTLSDTMRMLQGSDPRNFLFSNSISGHAMIFRRDLLADCTQLHSTPYIDWIIALLAANKGHIAYLPEALVDWRHHSSSVTSHARNYNQMSRRTILDNDQKIIEVFSKIPGKHQNFAIEATKCFYKWKHSYIDFSMFIFVILHGHVTHSARPAKFPSLRYLAGHKLKKLIRPNYY